MSKIQLNYPFTFEVIFYLKEFLYSYAATKDKKIILFIDKRKNFNTIYLLVVTLFVHELTHLIRIHFNKFKHLHLSTKNMKDYFLDSEEMIALYNQIVIESIFRKTSFEKCLNYYIENYINNIIIIKDNSFLNRFRNGIMRLNTIGKGKLWYNKIMEVNMTKTLEQSLEKFDEDMEIWWGSINRQIFNIEPEQQEAKLEEYRQYMREMRENIIKELSK